MRLNQGMIADVIKTLDFAIDQCEWEDHSETKGELMVSRAHAIVALNKLKNPALDRHYGWEDDSDE